MVPANSYRISRVPHYSGYCYQITTYLYEDFTLYGLPFQVPIPFYSNIAVLQPQINALLHLLVWAIPRSLATTYGITFVFFSYGYLDVSVPTFASLLKGMIYLQYTGLPHSEIHGSKVICTSPAYRSLSRPSSPPRAKASTRCLIYFLLNLNSLFRNELCLLLAFS